MGLKCNTPGCTHLDFHDGPHSFETVSSKRSREPISAAPKRLKDDRGFHEYGGLCKAGHREAFVHAALDTKRKVAYLEGPDGALTSLLLSRGVPRERLVPYNLSRGVSAAIEAAFPGVVCVVEDLCKHAASAHEEEFSVVWFDMCGVDFGNFDVADLVDCAEYKFFTISCRQLLCAEQQAVLCRRLVQSGEKLIESSLYTGRSGRAMNMVFVASKRSGRKNARSECSSSDDNISNEYPGVGTIVKVPLSCWKDARDVYDHGLNVFEGGFLMGAVHSNVTSSPLQYRLAFQLEGGGSKVCSRKYSVDFVQRHMIM